MLHILAFALSAWQPIDAGQQVLRNIAEARAKIRTGTVELHEFWESNGDLLEYDATAMFDEGHFRLDVHDHTAFKPDPVKEGQTPRDPLRMVFDGKKVLDRMIQLNVATFRISDLPGTRMPFDNARLLGLPGAPGDKLSIEECLRLDAKIESYTRDGDLHTVAVSFPGPAGKPTTLQFTCDATKGWNVVEFLWNSVAKEGIGYRIRSVSTPMQFGDVWFPAQTRKETWRDGVLTMQEECSVVDATFNKPLDADTFTWAGIGISHHAIIQSTIPGVPSETYFGPVQRAQPASKAKGGTKNQTPSPAPPAPKSP